MAGQKTESAPNYFEVTCVVGRVELGPGGTMAPSVAALQLIAEHDSEGVYTFPMEDGRTYRVTVEFTGEAGRWEHDA